MTETARLVSEARRELARLPPVLDALVGDLDDATWRARPAPGEWAPIEIVCHLRDEETDDFGARVHVILDGRHAVVPIDPVGWVEARRYRDAVPRDALGALHAHRAASLELLASIRADRLGDFVEHRTLGRLSGLDLLVAWVTHDRLHLHQLAGTLARLWATRWAPFKADYAGPIPYAPGAPD